MPFTPKDWKDSPDPSTPITAVALEDMETRLAAYTDRPGRSVSGGKSVVSAPGTRANVAYGALTNGPDEVAGVVLPTDGLIVVWYFATWQESVTNTARASIFV